MLICILFPSPSICFPSLTNPAKVVIHGLPFVLQLVAMYPRCPHASCFECSVFVYWVAEEHSKSVQITFSNQGKALLVLIIKALLHQNILYSLRIFQYPQAFNTSKKTNVSWYCLYFQHWAIINTVEQSSRL